MKRTIKLGKTSPDFKIEAIVVYCDMALYFNVTLKYFLYFTVHSMTVIVLMTDTSYSFITMVAWTNLITSVLGVFWSSGSNMHRELTHRELYKMYQAGNYSEVGSLYGVQGVHLAQGKDPTSMTVSWSIPLAANSSGLSQV